MSALSLDDAKRHLNITKADWDAELQAIIDGAEAALAERVGPLAPTTVTRRIAGSSPVLVLPITPVISLTSVTPYQGSALNPSNLYVDQVTGLVTANNLTGFPALYYDVVYSAGRTTCPNDLLFADKELVRHLFATQRGGTVRGSSAETTPPNSRATGPVPGVAYLLPNRVLELIAPHIQGGVG